MASFSILSNGFWVRFFSSLPHSFNLDSNPGRKAKDKISSKMCLGYKLGVPEKYIFSQNIPRTNYDYVWAYED